MPVLYRAKQDPIENMGSEESLSFKFTDEKFEIEGAPQDISWDRWAICHDKKVERLYFFKAGSDSELYQFVLNGSTFVFDNSISPIQLLHEMPKGEGVDFNPDNVSMLTTPNFNSLNGKVFSGEKLPNPSNYHFYFLKNRTDAQGGEGELYQYLWEDNTLRLRPNGITTTQLLIEKAPTDLDWDNWAMHYDSNHYLLAMEHYYFMAFKKGSVSELYYGRYNGAGKYSPTQPATLAGDPPANINYERFDLSFDGVECYMYFMGND